MRTPLILLAVSAAALSQAGMVLGIDNSGLYKIDTATGAATLAASLSGHGSGDTNGLAYNPLTNTAYFQRNGSLWSANLTSGAFAKTSYTIGSGVDAATFHNGAYLYSSGADIRKVDFAATGSTSVFTFAQAKSFGDFATTPSGMLYGSSGSGTFRVNLASGNAYANLPTSGRQLQLAFSGATLYGIANGNAGAPAGTMYSINLTTGAQTATGAIAKYNGSALAVRDAATMQGVPEPASMAALAVGAAGLLRRRRKA